MAKTAGIPEKNVRWYFAWGISGAGLAAFGIMRLHHVPFEIAWKDALISAGLLIIITQVLYFIQNNFHPPTPLNTTTCVTVIVFTAIFQGAFNASTFALFERHDWEQYVHSYMLIRGMIVFLVLLLTSFYWWIRKNEQIQQKINQQLLEKERALTKAELDNIHQQLQPHFLFNSLNSIGALTILEPMEAHRMIQLLSNFLRGTLRKDIQELVPLKEEIDQLGLYLEIEKVRFGHRLTTDINYSDSCEHTKLPPLILQPVIENAIKYGLYGQTNDLLITIDISCSDKLLTVAVTSPYDPEFVAGGSGNGFGLASIQRRLSLFFGQTDLLSTSKDDSFFTTTLCIPQL